MNTWTQEEAIRALQEVMRKSTVDFKFRKLVLENPDEAFKIVAGKELPANEKIKFVENSPGINQTFVLPDFKSELSENELNKVVGGYSVFRDLLKSYWSDGIF